MWSDGVLGVPPSHLRLTATHRGAHLSVTPSTSSDYQPFPPVPGTSAFRRYIYDYNLWAKSDFVRVSRISSAKFYRENPALTHRVIAFINRELNAILDSCQAILPQVIASLSQYDIRSRKFRRIVEPHLVRRTDQFIHEVYSFATSSCHDMMEYDNRVVYVRKEQARIFTTEPPVPPLGFSYEVESSDSEDERAQSVKSNSSSVIEILDSDDDDIQVAEEEVSTDNVITEVVAEATLPIAESEVHINIIDDLDNPRPGPSGLSLRSIDVSTRHRHRDSDADSDLDIGRDAKMRSAILDDSDSDESVQIVGSRKALRERTPVLVDLSDDDDRVGNPWPRSRKMKHQKRKPPSPRRVEDDMVELVEKKEEEIQMTEPSKVLSNSSEAVPVLKSVIGNVIINGKSKTATVSVPDQHDDVEPVAPQLKSVVTIVQRSVDGCCSSTSDCEVSSPSDE